MPQVRKLAFISSLWVFIGYGTQQFMRFFSNLILTRLLEPELFGLMALMTSIRIGLELFSDVGIGHNVIQNENGDKPEFYNTAWTLQIIRGFILWLLALLITGPFAGFYGEKSLLYLLPIISFTTVLDGFTSTSDMLLRRQLKLGIFTIYRLALQFICILIMVVWAWISPDIGALIAGTIASAGLGIIGTHFILPGPPNRLCWDKNALKQIIDFGKWIFLSTIFFFLADQADRLILAKIFSFEVVGVYTIAFTLSSLPKQILRKLSSQVIFPAFSKIKDLPRHELRSKIAGARSKFLLASALSLAVLSSFGDLLVEFLYDERYADASWMFCVLCFGVWFSIIANIDISALMGLGKPIYNVHTNIARLTTILLGMWIGFRFFGLLGAVSAVALSDLGGYLGIQFGLISENIHFARQDLLMTTLFFAGTFMLMFMRVHIGLGTPFDPLMEGR